MTTLLKHKTAIPTVYIQTLNIMRSQTGIDPMTGHSENSGRPGFIEVRPAERSRLAGYVGAAIEIASIDDKNTPFVVPDPFYRASFSISHCVSRYCRTRSKSARSPDNRRLNAGFPAKSSCAFARLIHSSA